MPEVVLAVDVGGTKLALALVDGDGTVLAEDVRATPAWRAFPLVDHVRRAAAEATGRRVEVGLANDGHCFALGEHWLGAGRDVASLVGLVLSTGVGAGAVLEGDVIFEPLRRHLADFAALPYVVDLEVRAAVHENAGLLGAAKLALDTP